MDEETVGQVLAVLNRYLRTYMYVSRCVTHHFFSSHRVSQTWQVDNEANGMYPIDDEKARIIPVGMPTDKSRRVEFTIAEEIDLILVKEKTTSLN